MRKFFELLGFLADGDHFDGCDDSQRASEGCADRSRGARRDDRTLDGHGAAAPQENEGGWDHRIRRSDLHMTKIPTIRKFFSLSYVLWPDEVNVPF